MLSFILEFYYNLTFLSSFYIHKFITPGICKYTVGCLIPCFLLVVVRIDCLGFSLEVSGPAIPGLGFHGQATLNLDFL